MDRRSSENNLQGHEIVQISLRQNVTLNALLILSQILKSIKNLQKQNSMKSNKNGDRHNHGEKVLATCIKTFIPTLDEESYTRCLSHRKNGFHSMLLQLIKDCESKTLKSRDGIHKIVSQIGDKIVKDGQFAGWIGESFKLVWIVLFIAAQETLGFQDILKSLAYIDNHGQFSDMKSFLSSLGVALDFEGLQDHDRMKSLLLQIESNQTWKNLNSRLNDSRKPTSAMLSTSIPAQTQTQTQKYNREQSPRNIDPIQFFSLDDQDQIQKIYDQMGRDLNRMQNAVLDKFIQENMMQAFASQFLKNGHYGIKNYHEFAKKLEELAKKFDVYSTGLGMELEDITNQDKFYNKILKIRSKIHPAFVPELMSLLNRGKKTRGAIQNKDTIVLLGPSGAGKSTTIQVLLGYKLKKGRGSDGIQTLMPTEKLKEQHKQFVAKASSKSVTKYVSAINMNLEEYGFYQSIYLVDTPGFFDTGGVVVDACNSLSTIEILGSANSIRFGFIFNYKAWGKRADAFKEFVKLISKLFKNYEANSSKVIYFLNQFTTQEINNFPQRVREFRRNGLNQYDKGDKRLLEVVDHIIQLLQKAERMAKRLKGGLAEAINTEICEQMVLLDPTSTDLIEVYQKLLSPSRKITNPRDQLDNVVSEAAKQTLTQEVVQLECIINRCMQNKHIDALHYYYKNLMEIAEITKNVDDCAQAQQKCHKLRYKIKQQYDKKLERYKTHIAKILMLNLDEMTIAEIKQEKFQLEQNAKNFSTLPGLQKFEKNEQILSYVEEVNNKLLDKIEEKQGISQNLYQTILLFSKYFNPKLIENFAHKRLKKQKELVDQIERIIKTHQFEKFNEVYDRLVQIGKYCGDMEEKINLQQFKNKALKIFEEVAKNFEKFINDQKICESILEQTDVQKINKTLSSLFIESGQLSHIKQLFFNKTKSQILELFRFYATKIKLFIKNKEDSMKINSFEERKVFICKKNATQLLKVKQIQRQAQYEFKNILDQIDIEIKTSNDNIDQLVEDIRRDSLESLQSLKNIYRQIRRLQRLNLLCQLNKRSENNSKISISQNLLINKLEAFETQIQFVLYNLETYNNGGKSSNKTTQMLVFYKQCSYILQQFLNSKTKKANLQGLFPQDPNQAEKDQVVQICDRIVEKIKIKIESVVDQIFNYIQSKMETIPKIKNYIDIPDGVVSHYWRIKKFFDTIKNTNFNPPGLNIKISTAKENFIGNFYKIYQFLQTFVIGKITGIKDLIQKNNMESVQRQQVSEIIKIKILIEKLNKLSQQLESSDIMKQEEYEDQIGISSQINRAIEDLYNSISVVFDKNHRNGAYQKCNYLINSCRILESFDILNKEGKFMQLSKDLNSKVDKDISLIQKSYEDIIQLETLTTNFVGFKKVFNYFHKFPNESLQNKKMNEVVDHLQRVISKYQKNLISKIKSMAKMVQFSKQKSTEKTKAQEIQTELTKIFEAIKEINEIISVRKLKIEINEQNQKEFGQAFVKIVGNQVQRVKKLVNKGNLEDALDTLQSVDNLEDIYSQFKHQNQVYKKLLEKQSCQNLNLAEKLRKDIQKIRDQRDKKYKGEIVQIDANFSEEIQAFGEKEVKQIEQKVINQIRKKIQEISKKNLKETQAQIKALDNLKKQPEFLNLSRTLKEKVEDMISKRQEDVNKNLDKDITEANSLKFSKIVTVIKNQDRSHVLKIYESKIGSEFDEALEKLKSVKNAEEAKQIIDPIFNTIKESEISKHQNVKKIYQTFCEYIVRIILDLAIARKINNLKKILYFQKYNKQSNPQNDVEVLVKEIKDLLKLLQSYKNRIKKFDLKKGLEELNLLNSFADQLLKKNELSFQQITKKQAQPLFCSWRYEALNLNACVSGLKDIEQIHELESFTSSLELKLKEVERKQEEFRSKVEKIEKQVLFTEFYNENNKNISDHERREQLRKIQEKINLLKALQRLGEPGQAFFNKNFTLILKNAEINLKKQIQDGIQSNCKNIKTGFAELQVQFSKQINVSMNLVSFINETLTFIKIDKNLKTRLTVTIDQSYKNIQERLQEALSNILALKDTHENQIKKQVAANASKKKEIEQKCTKKENQLILQWDKKLKDHLKDVKEEEKIKQIKKAHESQLNLKKKEIWYELEESFISIEGENRKKELTAQQKFTMVFEKYCDLVTIFYKAALELNYKQDYFKEKLEKILSEHKKSMKKKSFYLIYEILKVKRNSYASILIGSLDIFKNNQAIKWEAKVKGNDIEYVLKELYLTDSKKDSLKKMFDKYQSQFRNWTKQYQASPTQVTIDKLLGCIKNSSQNCSKFYQNKLKLQDFKPYHLVGQILVLWTIIKSDIEDETVEFYYQPHPSQVITIFLCLSLVQDDFPRDLNSKMAQVGTGEGKSLILAGLSSYLALCGFEVSCVCYSEYLSSRDYASFHKLFETLRISNKITYGTFNTICESLLNKSGKQQKFSDQIKKILEERQPENVKNYLWNQLSTLFQNLLPKVQSNDLRHLKKIMLIDEVDAFFNRDYFGEMYRPEVCISSPQIKNLIKYVWKKYKQNPEITDTDIKSSQQYQNAIKRFSKTENLLKQQIKGMILGCRNCNHDYIVREDMIQYKENDGFSSKINYGFTTKFAYLKEHDYNRIASIQKAYEISYIIAEFSYAMLPKYFRSIIGVTGTYQDMPQHQKYYMRDQYQVRDTYVIPSVYGSQKRRQICPELITDPENHWKEIIKEIEKVHATERPILVFFQTSSELESFYNCSAFQHLQSKTTFLNETHNPGERDLRIKKTCQKRQITLMTKSFGRGTDFIAFDESIFSLGHGGLYVIQTFLSTETSEEIQIQGRTARQGDPGSYILIIKKSDLQRLQMTGPIKNFQHQLKYARKQKQQKQYEQTIKLLKQSQQKHSESIKVYLNQNIKQKDIISHIQKLNKFEQIRRKSCKTCILFDGTVSMSRPITKLHAILEEGMNDISETIAKYPNAKQSQIQLGVYRNYNCKASMILQTTSFENRPQNLLNFWKDVKVQGGMGNQALEVAYNYLNSHPEIDQAIIIGDAAANTESQTIQKRSKYEENNLIGEQYWSKYIPILSADKQLEKIKARKLPIHCFYIKADEYFKKVSRETGGVAQKFNIENQEASKKLSHFIVSRILNQAAQNEAEAKLMIKQYEMKQKKRYSS